MSDTNERSVASDGSVDYASRPAVWAILGGDGKYRLPEIVDGVKVCRFYDNDRYVPLYAETQRLDWIPATERLPEDGAWCWVDWDGPGLPFPAVRCSRSAGGWTNSDTWEDFDGEVTHWIAIPAPPKVGK